MKHSWAQPSLSRDFALLSAAILFILFMVSAWVTYTTYTTHSDRIAAELEKEAVRIEHTLGTQMESANYMLTALGRQIVLDPDRNLTRLAEILKSFDSKGYIYTIFSWVSPDQKVLVSSNKGVLEKPVDISDRDYVKRAFADPWKMNIGRPIEGRVSGRWVIPVAMGLTDYTGKFIGIIMISIDINTLTDQLSNLVKRDGISFAIVSKTLIPLTQVSDDKDFVNNNFPAQKLVNVNFAKNPSGLIAQGSLFWGTGNYAYYRMSQDYPYIVLLGYDTRYSDEAVRNLLWSRLLQMVIMAVFFVLFLIIVRARMIRPVVEMTSIVTAVANGEAYRPLPKGGAMELEGLAAQIRRVGEYIDENKRIEQELRYKMFILKQGKEQQEMENRSKSEFLAWVCQEFQAPLNNIVSAAQVMKDQLYGPIENRKYRQYATDIYGMSNALMGNAQELLTLANAETGHIELKEKPVDVAATADKALRSLSDRLQAEKQGVKTHWQDPLPRLMADEFRLQQIIANLLQYVLAHVLPGGMLRIEAKTGDSKDKAFFALMISTYDYAPANADLAALADRLLHSPPAVHEGGASREISDIALELAKALIMLHNGAVDIRQGDDGAMTVFVLWPAARIRPADTA